MSEIKLNLEVFLQDLAAREPSDIDSDDFDFYGEDDSGNECSCSISIVGLAQEAVDTIAALNDENARLAAECIMFREEVQQHKDSIHYCETCGDDDPCDTDDVCRALDRCPATDLLIEEVRAQAIESVADSVEALGIMVSSASIRDHAANIRAAAKGEGVSK